MAKKINLDEIDESLIIAAVKKDKSSVPENPERLLTPGAVEQSETITEEKPEQTKEESKRKRKTQDYESLFIRESNVTARLGKTVYIRKEHHDRILKIVRVIGENEFSLFNYLDNVLEHHFNIYQDEITELYHKKNTDVF